MCGIIGGYYSYSKRSQVLNEGLSQIRHRGPDTSRFYKENIKNRRLYLGHARLSIIDLTDDANQPLYLIVAILF